MELTINVSKHHRSGTPSEVIKEIKEYENGFALLPLTEPKIDNYKVLVNGAEMFNFVSNHYKILYSGETLERLAEFINDEDYTAEAYWSRQIAVHIKKVNTNGLINSILYVNSYDKKLREGIILPDIMYATKHVHRASGLNKIGLNLIFKILEDEGNHSLVFKALSEKEISKNAISKMITNLQIPSRKVLLQVLHLDYDSVKNHPNHDEMLVENFGVFGYNVTGLIKFTHALFGLYVKEMSYDKAVQLMSNVSQQVTKTTHNVISTIFV